MYNARNNQNDEQDQISSDQDVQPSLPSDRNRQKIDNSLQDQSYDEQDAKPEDISDNDDDSQLTDQDKKDKQQPRYVDLNSDQQAFDDRDQDESFDKQSDQFIADNLPLKRQIIELDQTIDQQTTINKKQQQNEYIKTNTVKWTQQQKQYIQQLIYLINTSRYSNNVRLNEYLDDLSIKILNKFKKLMGKYSASVVYDKLETKIRLHLKDIYQYLNDGKPFPHGDVREARNKIARFIESINNQKLNITSMNQQIAKVRDNIRQLHQGTTDVAIMLAHSDDVRVKLTAEQAKLTKQSEDLVTIMNKKDLETYKLKQKFKALDDKKNKLKEKLRITEASLQQTKTQQQTINTAIMASKDKNQQKTKQIEQQELINQKEDQDSNVLFDELPKLRAELSIQRKLFDNELINQNNLKDDLQLIQIDIASNELKLDNLSKQNVQLLEYSRLNNEKLKEEKDKLTNLEFAIEQQEKQSKSMTKQIQKAKVLLEAKIQELSNESEKAKLLKQQNQQQFDTQLRDITDKQQINNQMQHKLEQDINDLNSELAVKKAAISDKQSEIQLAKTNNVSKQDQQLMQTELNEAQLKTNQLLVKITGLETDKTNINNQIGTDTSILTELESRLMKLLAKIDIRQKKKAKQESELQTIKAAIEAQTDKLADIEQKLQTQQASMTKQSDDLTAKQQTEINNQQILNNLNKTVQTLKQDISELEAKKDRRDTAIQSNTDKLDLLAPQLADIESKITEINKLITTQTASIIDKEQEEKAIRLALKNAQDVYSNMINLQQVNPDTIKNKIDIKQQEYDELIKENQKLMEEIKILDTRAERLDQEIKGQQQLNVDKEKELKQYDDQLNKLQANVTELDSQLIALHNIKNDLEQQIKEHSSGKMIETLKAGQSYALRIMAELKARMDKIAQFKTKQISILKKGPIDQFPVLNENGEVQWIPIAKVAYFIAKNKEISLLEGSDKIYQQESLRKEQFGYLLASLVHINYQVLSKELIDMTISIAEVVKIIQEGGAEVYGQDKQVPLEDKEKVKLTNDEVPVSLIGKFRKLQNIINEMTDQIEHMYLFLFQEIDDTPSVELKMNLDQFMGLDKGHRSISSFINSLKLMSRESIELRKKIANLLKMQPSDLKKRLENLDAEQWLKAALLSNLQSMNLDRNTEIINLMHDKIKNILSEKNSTIFEETFNQMFNIDSVGNNKSKLTFLLMKIGLGKIDIKAIPGFLMNADKLRGINNIQIADELGNFLSSMMQSFVQPIAKSMNRFNKVADQFKKQAAALKQPAQIRQATRKDQIEQDKRRATHNQTIDSISDYSSEPEDNIVYMTNKHKHLHLANQVSQNMINAYCRAVINTMNLNHGFDLYNQ